MKTIGLTGGIGSGKSTIAGFFKDLGVPVYIADDQARALTDTLPEIKEDIMGLLGETAYTKEGLDRNYVAGRVFEDSELLLRLNEIIHPRVREDFRQWKLSQDAPYCIMEAAILFENGGYQNCDHTILVTAPLELRITRVMARDGVEYDSVMARMKHQWPDDKKRELADFIIENTDLEKTREQVIQLHQNLSQTP